jgi:uncharacterized Rmd1/YagE family protein
MWVKTENEEKKCLKEVIFQISKLTTAKVSGKKVESTHIKLKYYRKKTKKIKMEKLHTIIFLTSSSVSFK